MIEPDHANPDILSELYHERGLTQKEIADELECHHNTIRRHMNRLGIESRAPDEYNPDRFDVSEDWLREQYADEERTMEDIADEVGCSAKTISNRMDRWSIERRNRAHNRTLHPAIYIHDGGYRVAQCSTSGKRVGLHQLTAIADGADPERVFSGGEFHTHHVNRHKLDNRRENLLVLGKDDHKNLHSAVELLTNGSNEAVEAFEALMDTLT